MKNAIRPTSLSVAALALSLCVVPHVLAESSGGVSVFSKTVPSTPAPAPATPPRPAGAGRPCTGGSSRGPEGNTSGASRGSGARTECRWRGQRMDAQFGTAPPQTSQFTGAPEQVAIIEKINQYFNGVKNLEGEFLQTDADDKRKKGKFYIERPGKVRFDYSLPSRQKIISNGKYLAIEDHDLNTTDRYPLGIDAVPAVADQGRRSDADARIISLDVGDNVVVVTLQDKEASNGGQIRLFFDWPALQLKEWIISDQQGLNTRIQLADMQLNKDADPKLFTFSPDIGMPKFRGGPN